MGQEETSGSFYTIQEAAKILRVSEGTVWRWIRDRKLPAYKVGDRAIRIKKDDLPLVVKRTNAEAQVVEEVTTTSKEQQLLVLKKAGALRTKIENRLGKPLPSSVKESHALREKRAHVS